MVDALSKDDSNCYIFEADLSKLDQSEKQKVYEMMQIQRCFTSLSIWDNKSFDSDLGIAI